MRRYIRNFNTPLGRQSPGRLILFRHAFWSNTFYRPIIAVKHPTIVPDWTVNAPLIECFANCG